MTPTREQIEAAAKAIFSASTQSSLIGLDACRTVATAALTAAAQVEIMPQMIAQQNARLEAQRIKEDRATMIERCAQVADEYTLHLMKSGMEFEANGAERVAAAIRALKD